MSPQIFFKLDDDVLNPKPIYMELHWHATNITIRYPQGEAPVDSVGYMYTSTWRWL